MYTCLYTTNQGCKYIAHGNPTIRSVNKLLWNLKHLKNINEIEPEPNTGFPWGNELWFNRKFPISLVCVWEPLLTDGVPLRPGGDAHEIKSCLKKMELVMGYSWLFLQWVVTLIWTKKGSIWVQIFVWFNQMVQHVSKCGKEHANHESDSKHFWKSYDWLDGSNLRSGAFSSWTILWCPLSPLPWSWSESLPWWPEIWGQGLRLQHTFWEVSPIYEGEFSEISGLSGSLERF